MEEREREREEKLDSNSLFHFQIIFILRLEYMCVGGESKSKYIDRSLTPRARSFSRLFYSLSIEIAYIVLFFSILRAKRKSQFFFLHKKKQRFKLSNLFFWFSFKEKTPLTLQSLVVYRMNCLDCNEFYVGKTSRCLQRRVKEHRLGTGTEEYKSALFKHARSTGHRIDYNNPVILDKASNDNKLLLKEMLQINRLKPTLNTQKKSALFNMIIGN